MKLFFVHAFTGATATGAYVSRTSAISAIDAHKKHVGCNCTFKEVPFPDGHSFQLTGCECGAYDGAIMVEHIEVEKELPIV